MAHQLDFSKGEAAFAYVGEQAWHGYGFKLDEKSDMPTWLKASGMDYDVKASPTLFYDEESRCIDTMPDKKVLYRSDTKAALSIVSDRYQIVQPKEILGFFNDLTKAAGFTLETAGVLREGRRYWALARTNQSAMIAGVDKLEQYLLLSSSCDGSSATRGEFTSIRVVCNNTLTAAVASSQLSQETRVDDETGIEYKSRISIAHNKTVDFDKMKQQLGVYATSWEGFIAQANELAKREVKNDEVKNFIVGLFGKKDKPLEDQSEQDSRIMRQVWQLFEGSGKGSELESACGTAWGLVNAVTEYVDHHASSKNRQDLAWFGAGSTLKDNALRAAVALLD